MPQEKFHYKSLEEVKQRAAELGVDLPFAADTHALAQPLTVRNITFPNRLGIAPMEGADSTPGRRTHRVYDPPLCQRGYRWQLGHLVRGNLHCGGGTILPDAAAADPRHAGRVQEDDHRRQGGGPQGQRLCAVFDHAGQPQRPLL